MKIKDKIINKYIKESSHIKLYYFEDEIYGCILQHSDDFILIADIIDWHFNSFMIFPKSFIDRIRYSKIEKFREKVMIHFGDKLEKKVNWLNLESIDTIIDSLKKHYNKVCIECATKDINKFMIGKVLEYDKKNIYLQELDIFAKLKSKKTKVSKKNITCMYFNDEYSSKLFEYNKTFKN